MAFMGASQYLTAASRVFCDHSFAIAETVELSNDRQEKWQAHQEVRMPESQTVGHQEKQIPSQVRYMTAVQSLVEIDRPAPTPFRVAVRPEGQSRPPESACTRNHAVERGTSHYRCSSRARLFNPLKARAIRGTFWTRFMSYRTPRMLANALPDAIRQIPSWGIKPTMTA